MFFSLNRHSKIDIRKFLIIALLVLLVAAGGIFIYSKVVNATGGAYILTKHGSTVSGVDRSNIDSRYNEYGKGECNHCHDLHASFGGYEPNPVDGGANGYMIFTENNNEFCWTCHRTFNLNGKPKGWGFYSFYQGETIYLNSSHGNPAVNQNMRWPGLTGSANDPIWPRMADRSTISNQAGLCLNCHTPHGIKGRHDTGTVPIGIGTQDGLIPHQLIAREEVLCENCHDVSGPAVTDIQYEIDKRTMGGSGHPVDDTSLAGVHTVDEAIPVTSRHVECYDCHNPHAGKSNSKLEGIRYIDIDGVVRDPALGARQPYVYEVCFKCHGNTFAAFIPPGTTRPPAGSNKIREFDPRSKMSARVSLNGGGFSTNTMFNTSWHSVCVLGLNQSDVFNPASARYALKEGLDRTNTINCTDCHNNDINSLGIVFGPITESNLSTTFPRNDLPSNYTGNVAVGPHGSTGSRLLRANYSTAVGTGSAPFNSFDPNNFALCFLCHDITAFNQDSTKTNFYKSGGMGSGNLHYRHLKGGGGGGGGRGGGGGMGTYASCHECHYNLHSNVDAPHTQYVLNGVSNTSSVFDTTRNTHLLNFYPGVQGNSTTYPQWSYNAGTGQRNCKLRCHGKTHDKNYSGP